ncbi:MAG: sigma 54-interacting transcriptional regulator [bacterium]
MIAATNKDLQNIVEQNQFRADLFYRLNGFPIKLPPLSERQQDIPLLAAHFLKKHGYESVKGVSDRAVSALQTYSWPGNVRELENVLRRAAILVQSEGRDLIQLNDLPTEICESDSVSLKQIDYKSLEEQILESLRSLQFSHSAISKTAQMLGNRDRGTITEYFRGICFKEFVQANYDLDAAVKVVASTNDEKTLAKVRDKMHEYLRNLYPLPESPITGEAHVSSLPSQYKGLPKKYHAYLKKVIEHFLQNPSYSI